MPPREPEWWYEPPGARALALRPLAAAYGWIAGRRMQRPAAHASPLPVVCIGNLTLGGTGKTPVALKAGEIAAALGARVAFLSRGYGGATRGPHWVDPAADTAAEVGDEALLLARAAPAMVARDRAAGAAAIAARGGADLIVMDDGLQNPWLAKDLAIAVVDGRRGVGNGEVFPAGPLRAPLAIQLARVDAVVVNTAPQALAAGDGASPREGPPAASALRERFPGPVLAVAPVPAGDLQGLGRVAAFAGIGHPERFRGLLAAAGVEVAAFDAFPDHHTYTPEEAGRLLARAKAGLRLVTTEKDWVRLGGAEGACGRLRDAARPIAIRLAFAPGDEERLRSLIRSVLVERERLSAG